MESNSTPPSGNEPSLTATPATASTPDAAAQAGHGAAPAGHGAPPAGNGAPPAGPAKPSFLTHAKAHAKTWAIRGAVLGVSFFSLGLAIKLGPKYVSQNQSYRATEDFVADTFSEATDFFTRPWESAQRKVEALRVSEEQNERLRLENAFLKTKVEALQFDCHEKTAAEATKQVETKLVGLTGTKLGRTLASMSYQVPEHLLPHQLYALAMTYFKAKEWEKAVVLLSFLSHLEDQHLYRGPRESLLTGVAWYRLDNLDLADQSFDEVLKATESPDALMYQAQARLWKGLTAQRLGKAMKAQYWFRELVDHHPHSSEAGWINGVPGHEISKVSEVSAPKGAAGSKEIQREPAHD